MLLHLRLLQKRTFIQRYCNYSASQNSKYMRQTKDLNARTFRTMQVRRETRDQFYQFLRTCSEGQDGTNAQ